MNTQDGLGGSLLYAWGCRVEVKRNDFCDEKNIPKHTEGNHFRIPAAYAISGTRYRFHMYISAEDDSHYHSTSQVVVIKEGAIELLINCVENCHPASKFTNIELSLKVNVTCPNFDGCLNMTDDKFQWSLNDTTFDYDTKTLGRTSNTFTIVPNVFQYGNYYMISVRLIDDYPGYVSKILALPQPLKIESCNIYPTSGITFLTQFRVSCDVTPAIGVFMYKVYIIKGENATKFLIDNSPELSLIDIRLSANSKVMVKVVDEVRLLSDTKIIDDIDVKEIINKTLKGETLIEAIERTFYSLSDANSIPNFLDSQHSTLAIQAANFLNDALIDAVNRNPEDGPTEKMYQTRILNDLLNVPINTTERALQLGSIISKIVDRFDNTTPPEMVSLTTTFCKNIADAQHAFLKTDPEAGEQREDVASLAELLAKCSEAASKQNQMALEAQAASLNISSTGIPLMDADFVTENYPEYVDDDNSSIALSNYRNASENMIDICFSTAKSIGLTIKKRKAQELVTSKSFNITYLRDFGYLIPKKRVESMDVFYVTSQDFKHFNFITEVLLCTTTNNPFWWRKQSRVQTSVAMLFVVNMNTHELVTTYKEPFQISFNFTDDPASLVETNIGTLPGTNYTDDMALHRILIPREMSYFVEFYDLGEAVLDVVIVHFRTPTLKDFTRKTVTKNSSKMFQEYSYNYNGWEYLTIHRNQNDTSTTKYNFSVYSLSCFEWSSDEINWKVACGGLGSSTFEQVDCACHHLSTLIGRFENIPVENQPMPLKIEVEMKFTTSYIVFVTLTFTFIVFCVCSVIFALMPTPRENFLFLGDVSRFSRYSYVINVNTSNRFFAGTTSNIVLKIYGNKSESEEHVLNYPDPEKRLLQRDGEDWFVLGTENHLGDLEKIELNIHWTGVRPTWHCYDITIYDIQEEKFWLFVIDMWFNIATMEESIFTFTPSEIKEVKMNRIVYEMLEQPHFWNIKKPFEFFRNFLRLTTLYSQILVMYSLNLFFYGLPKLKLNDSLPYTCYYGLYPEVFLYAFASSMLAFIMHYGLISLIRNWPQLSNILWVILLINISFCTTFIIAFGFWVPTTVGLLWLTSSFFSIIFFVFVLENLARFLNVLFYTTQKELQLIFGKVKSMLEYIERQRVMLYESFGEYILRPYITPLYKPLTEDQLNEKKAKFKIKKIIIEILIDIGMFAVYITLLYVVISFQKDDNSYLNSKQIKSLVKKLLEDPLPYKLDKFSQIRTTTELLVYFRNTLLVALQGNEWYKNYLSSQPGMMSDFQNKYLGVMRFRQLRVANHSCVVPEQMKYLELTCNPEFSFHPEYRNFGQGWSNDTQPTKFLRLGEAWLYATRGTGLAYSFRGEITTYPGGGYVVKMGRYLTNSLINFNYLLRNKWFDELTRCVFVEFLTYNANCNLFNSVRIIFEISATGFLNKRVVVDSARFIFVRMLVIKMAIFCSFIIVLTVLTFKTFRKVIKERKILFDDLWRLIDVVIVVLSCICIILFVEQNQLIRNLLDQLHHAKNNVFVEYFTLFRVDGFLTILAALLICVATIRLWRLLRFMLIFRIMEKTVVFSARDLLSLSIWHFVILLCFAFAGLILYGDELFEFRNFFTSFVNLVILSLNLHQSFDEIIQTSSKLTYPYYTIFMIITLLIFSLYVAIIMIYYMEAQIFYSAEKQYSVQDFLREQFKYFRTLYAVRIKQFRFRGGSGATEPGPKKRVTPKDDQFRYSKCITIASTRLAAMANITRCVLRNSNPPKKQTALSEADFQLMLKTAASMLTKKQGQKEMFYVGRTKDTKKVKIVDDLRLKKMEILTESMFWSDEETRRRRQLREQLFKKTMERHQKKLEFLEKYLQSLVDVMEKLDIE